MATKIPEETQLTSLKCWSKLGTGLLTSKQKLADLPFMLVSRHRLPVVEMLAISLRLPIRWPATR